MTKAQRFALMRSPGDGLAACELTHIERRGIDLAKARDQHAGLVELLQRLGVQVTLLPALEGFPDSCFVEDPVRAFGPAVICTRPGALTRRAELESLLPFLPVDRPCLDLKGEQSTLDGGDLMLVDGVLFCGQSSRSNHAGLKELAHLVLSLGLRVKAVPVHGALHLKTAVCHIGRETLLIQPEWVDLSRVGGLRCIEVDAAELFGANALRVGEVLIMPEEHPRTVAHLRAEGFTVETTPISEFLLAEAGVTCLCLLWEARS